MRSIELFAGAGGMALGIHQAGYRHVAIAEWDQHSVNTLIMNRALLGLDDLELEPTDVTKVNWMVHAGEVELLAGGVPCQPFSLAGKHRGHHDPRNLFPEMLRAVREIGAQAVLIENVKGLTRPSFLPYFQYVLRQLEMPELAPREDDSWVEHDARLLRERLSYLRGGYLRYQVNPRAVQCADFGVPQMRDRIFVVAYRSDLGAAWEEFAPTHSRDRLIYEQFVTAAYWRQYPNATYRRVPSELRVEAQMLSGALLPPPEMRWRTVRDALAQLPAPGRRRNAEHVDTPVCPACHWGNPGARAYTGHVGSRMDWPAKTLKAGVHGVPGGENMLLNTNGTVRYFTVREAAQLQTFPPSYHFPGTWGEAFRQLGNAVPVLVARLIAEQIADTIRRRTTRVTSEPMTLVASG